MTTNDGSLQKKIEILVVEDSSTQAQKLKHLLESHQFHVTLAVDGKQALEKIAEQIPDLVLTDIVMPVMNGYELCRQIKDSESTINIPVILLTSLANPEDVLEGLACGADNFITKPFSGDYLLSHIEQILANRRLVKVERVRIGVEIVFGGKRRFITADQQQMLSLLLSTYEAAAQRNVELIKTQEKLHALNDHLEELVEERTNELQSQRDFAETLINTAQAVILLLDQQGKIVHFNPYFAELSGYCLEEVLGKNWFDIFLTEGDRDKVAKLFAKAVVGNQTIGNVNTIICKDGSKREIEWYDKTIKDKNGQVTGLLAIGQDITEHRKGELKIQHLNRVLRAIRNVNQLIVREKDSDKLIQEACDMMIEFRGYMGAWVILTDSTGEFIQWVQAGLNVDIEKEQKKLQLKTLPKCCLNNEVTHEFSLISDRERLCPGCPLAGVKSDCDCLRLQLSHGNKVFGYLGVMIENSLGVDEEELSLFTEMAGDVAFALYSIDQTREMAAGEENRALLEAQLRQSHKMEAIGQLAGGVAHDFNNMLQIINSNAEMAMAALDKSSPAYESLVEILGAGERSAKLTRQLLAFARKQAIVPQVLDLNEVVSSILKMLKRLIGENIDLKWQPTDKKCLVNMDPAQIDQILANLIVNARDAIAGVGNIIIRTDKVDCAPAQELISSDSISGNFIRLSISDNGCGMSMETLGRIFEPFFTTKDLGTGTGLGLATVYGIVKQNSGFIHVDSQLGKGTAFAIYLPVCLTEKATEETHKSSEILGGTETILVVEDEPALLKICKRHLESLGYRTITVNSPEAALNIAKDFPDAIHLLLTDVIMPEMSGRDLYIKVKALRPALKCIFMSGYTADIIAQKGILGSDIHCLQKPFSKDALTIKLREVLDLKSKLTEQ
ncbi:MAG: response regulator [Candidatus Riflebacteria bacterium]|nr:response regulator [Candidatus Riflebacteria bacterium]